MLVKLVLSLVMTALVFILLLPVINSLPPHLPGDLSAAGLRAVVGRSLTLLTFPPLVSFGLLAVATVLSVFKPWTRTPWAR